jgi:hypothetical protein
MLNRSNLKRGNMLPVINNLISWGDFYIYVRVKNPHWGWPSQSFHHTVAYNLVLIPALYHRSAYHSRRWILAVVHKFSRRWSETSGGRFLRLQQHRTILLGLQGFTWFAILVEIPFILDQHQLNSILPLTHVIFIVKLHTLLQNYNVFWWYTQWKLANDVARKVYITKVIMNWLRFRNHTSGLV